MKLALLSPAVLLPVLGVLAGGAGIFLMMRLFGGKKAPAAAPAANGALAGLGNLADSPILHMLLSSLAQYAHDSGHALVNALILKAIPGLGAILTTPVDKLLDGIDAKIIGGQAPAAPAQPAGPTISIPTDHPDFPVIQGLLSALQQHRQQKAA